MLLVAAIGLGVDMARMLLVQQELHTRAKAAALRSALELDGTAAGLDRARQRAGVVETIEFASEPGEGWTEIPEDPQVIRLTRVTAKEAVGLTMVNRAAGASQGWVRARAAARVATGRVELVQ
jgi:hypothetical protein